MAPLSVLPGRVRFEIPTLVGRGDGCRVFKVKLLSEKGVKEASANYRTGRVLIRFDEKMISRAEMDICLSKALQAAESTAENYGIVSPRTASSDNPLPGGRLIMEMVAHAMLPAPLDLIFPAAMDMFRRQPASA